MWAACSRWCDRCSLGSVVAGTVALAACAGCGFPNVTFEDVGDGDPTSYDSGTPVQGGSGGSENRAATAVGLTKRAAQAGEELPLEQGLALEREILQRLSASHDAKEGILAFTQKRRAVFRAR